MKKRCALFLLFIMLFASVSPVHAGLVLVNSDSESSDTETSNTSETTVFQIIQQPQDIEIEAGEKASFVCVAEGDEVTYQWYFKTKKASEFKLWGGHTKSKFSYVPEADRDGLQAFCEITDANGETLQSEIITLTIHEAQISESKTVITLQPISFTIFNHQVLIVFCDAAGDGLSYQWMVKADGSDELIPWGTPSQAKMLFPLSAQLLNRLEVCCEITDKSGATITTDFILFRKN